MYEMLKNQATPAHRYASQARTQNQGTDFIIACYLGIICSTVTSVKLLESSTLMVVPGQLPGGTHRNFYKFTGNAQTHHYS